VTYKTATCDKEQVCVIIRETGESIKHIAIHRHKHWSGECGMFIEFYPVDVMVIGVVVGSGHDVLNESPTLHSSFIPLAQSRKNHYRNFRTNEETNGEEGDKHGVKKDDRGWNGAPRDRLQPDADDPIAWNPIKNKHIY
jgi:hypothetical protein